jgi:hypothetical protein
MSAAGGRSQSREVKCDVPVDARQFANSKKRNLHEKRPGGGVSSLRMKMCEIWGGQGSETVIGNGAVNDP